MDLLLLLPFNPGVLPLQRVDVRGHALHHHAVESGVVLTSTGIDGSRTQLRNVIRSQALLLTGLCTRGEGQGDGVGGRERDERGLDHTITSSSVIASR